MSGWRTAPLGELCDIKTGATPARAHPEYFGGNIPWVKIGDMVRDPITSTEESITQAGLKNSVAKLLPAGTVLISIFATIGRTAVLGIEAATNQAIAGVTPRDTSLTSRYLRLYLDSVVAVLEHRARGVAQVNINSSILRALPIPLPPLSVQRRIAKVLDRAEDLRAKRRAALAHLAGFTQAIFLEMFGDPVVNPKGWPKSKKLGEVAEIASGVTKGRKIEGKASRRVPYLAVANVQDQALDLSVVKTIEATDSEIRRYRLKKNDLLLTEGGDPDKLGRGTLWNDELPECIHQNHIFRVRLGTSELTPLFLSHLIGSQRGKRYFLRSAKQTTGIASINMTQLRSFPLLIPPLQLQRDFDLRVSAVETLKAAHRASLAEMDALFASLQYRAFRGEL